MAKPKIIKKAPDTVAIINGFLIISLPIFIKLISFWRNSSKIITETILLTNSNAKIGNAMYELIFSPNKLTSTGKLMTTKLVLLMHVTIAPWVLLFFDIFLQGRLFYRILTFWGI